MSKEDLLHKLQELILSLKSSNIKNDRVKKIWVSQEEKLLEDIEKLSEEDKLWLDREYIKWFKENIVLDS